MNSASKEGQDLKGGENSKLSWHFEKEYGVRVHDVSGALKKKGVWVVLSEAPLHSEPKGRGQAQPRLLPGGQQHAHLTCHRHVEGKGLLPAEPVVRFS